MRNLLQQILKIPIFYSAYEKWLDDLFAPFFSDN